MFKLINIALPILLFMSSSAFGWEQTPGAAKDVTDGWKIGTSTVAGGYEIHRWNGAGWTKIPGGAEHIGGTYSSPWMINNQNKIYHWSGSGWQLIPGKAKDVADGWVLGTDTASGGYAIYRWNGTSWDYMPGGAVHIGGTYSAPWMVNNQNKIYHWNGSGWQLMPGKAKDVADGWMIGTGATSGGYKIYRWNGAGWTQIPGGAMSIGTSGGTPWIVNNTKKVYRY
jgi:hypothetical protein